VCVCVIERECDDYNAEKSSRRQEFCCCTAVAASQHKHSAVAHPSGPTAVPRLLQCSRYDGRSDGGTFLWKLFVFVYSRLNLFRDYIRRYIYNIYCIQSSLLLLHLFVIITISPLFFSFSFCDSREI